MDLPSECTVCSGDQIETIEHYFQTCIEVQKAWEIYSNLRQKSNLPQEIENWERILMGNALTTNRTYYADEIPWDAKNAFIITNNTPCDIMRTNLLWHIWTQRCNHNFRDKKFSIANALANAWHTTIQIGVPALYERVKYRNKRNQRKQAQSEETFTNIWTEGNIFSSTLHNSIHWKFTPDATFLPKDLAKDATLTNGRRRRPARF